MLAVFVSQEMEYGEVVSSVPKLFPSNLNWIPATPEVTWPVTVGSEALAETVTEPETVEPAVGVVITTVGLVVSGRAKVVAIAALD
jgi:hypothetical protein